MLALCFLLFSLPQQGRDARVDGMFGQLIANEPDQIISLASELELLQDFADLSDNDLNKLRAEAEAIIRKETSRRRGKKEFQATSIAGIWPDLYEQLLPVMQKHVSDKEQFELFKDDLKLRQQVDRDFAITESQYLISRSIGLTREQSRQLSGLLTRLYANGQLGTPPFRGHDTYYRYLNEPVRQLKPTPEQQTNWRTLAPEVFADPNTDDALSDDTDDQREEDLRRYLQAVATTEIASIEVAIDISDKTRRRLQVAAKGAIKRLLKVRIKAENDFAAALRREEPPAFDSDLYSIATCTKSSLFHETGAWRKLVRSSLNDDQWKQLEAHREKKFEMSKLRFASHLRSSLTWNIQLTGRQQIDFRDMVVTLVPSRKESIAGKDRYRPWKRLYQVPKSRYVELMGEDNYELFAETLEYYRENFFPDVKQESPEPDDAPQLR